MLRAEPTTIGDPPAVSGRSQLFYQFFGLDTPSETSEHNETSLAMLSTEVMGILVTMIDLWDVAKLFCIGNELLSSTLISIPRRRKIEFCHPDRLASAAFPPITAKMGKVRRFSFEIDPSASLSCRSDKPLQFLPSKMKEMSLSFRNSVDWWISELEISKKMPCTPRGSPNLKSRFSNLRTLRLVSTTAMSRQVAKKVLSSLPTNLKRLSLGSIGDSSTQTFELLPRGLEELSFTCDLFHMSSLERLTALSKFVASVSVISFSSALALPQSLKTFEVRGIIEVRRDGETLGGDIGPLLKLLPRTLTSLDVPSPLTENWMKMPWWPGLVAWGRNTRQTENTKAVSRLPPFLTSLVSHHATSPVYLDPLLGVLEQSTLVRLELKRTVMAPEMLKYLPPTLTSLWVSWSPSDHSAFCAALPKSVTELTQGQAVPEALQETFLSSLPPTVMCFQLSHLTYPTWCYVNMRVLGREAPKRGQGGSEFTSLAHAIALDSPTLFLSILSLDATRLGARALARDAFWMENEISSLAPPLPSHALPQPSAHHEHNVHSLAVLFLALKAGARRILHLFDQLRLTPHYRVLATQERLNKASIADLAVEYAPTSSLTWLEMHHFEFIISPRILHAIVQKNDTATIKWLYKRKLWPSEQEEREKLTNTGIVSKALSSLQCLLELQLTRFNPTFIVGLAKKEGAETILNLLKSINQKHDTTIRRRWSDSTSKRRSSPLEVHDRPSADLAHHDTTAQLLCDSIHLVSIDPFDDSLSPNHLPHPSHSKISHSQSTQYISTKSSSFISTSSSTSPPSLGTGNVKDGFIRGEDLRISSQSSKSSKSSSQISSQISSQTSSQISSQISSEISLQTSPQTSPTYNPFSFPHASPPPFSKKDPRKERRHSSQGREKRPNPFDSPSFDPIELSRSSDRLAKSTSKVSFVTTMGEAKEPKGPSKETLPLLSGPARSPPSPHLTKLRRNSSSIRRREKKDEKLEDEKSQSGLEVKEEKQVKEDKPKEKKPEKSAKGGKEEKFKETKMREEKSKSAIEKVQRFDDHVQEFLLPDTSTPYAPFPMAESRRERRLSGQRLRREASIGSSSLESSTNQTLMIESSINQSSVIESSINQSSSIESSMTTSSPIASSPNLIISDLPSTLPHRYTPMVPLNDSDVDSIVDSLVQSFSPVAPSKLSSSPPASLLLSSGSFPTIPMDLYETIHSLESWSYAEMRS